MLYHYNNDDQAPAISTADQWKKRDFSNPSAASQTQFGG